MKLCPGKISVIHDSRKCSFMLGKDGKVKCTSAAMNCFVTVNLRHDDHAKPAGIDLGRWPTSSADVPVGKLHRTSYDEHSYSVGKGKSLNLTEPTSS